MARVDAGGALRVGPRSAGARPGPICYGLGGSEVTVTDAHVWLGRLPSDGFLGGARSLDRALIEGPMQALAEALGKTPEEAAEGVLSVADTAMERALRVISVERGYDPVDFVVVAFGGAGALHVAELTHRLGARKAIIPPDPGLLSAYGMLTSPITREVSRTILLDTDDPGIDDRVSALLSELDGQARRALLEEGAEPDALVTERWIDARYRGQSFELGVPAENWIAEFHEAHAERYGYQRPETAVEAVTLRVVVTAPAADIEPVEVPRAELPPEARAVRVVFAGTELEASCVRRDDLRAGHDLEGPLVVQEYSGTTWVPPGWRIRVDEWGSLHLTAST